MSNEHLQFRVEKLSTSQIEKAAMASRTMYPQDCPCAGCGYRWMQHKGLLCPETEGYVSRLVNPLTGQYVIVPPTFGTRLFMPDEAYYKAPDFDVV